MKSQYQHLPPEALADLDLKLVSAEDQRWQSFYADRARPCPFFGTEPDENLAEWLELGRIPVGKALDIGCGNGRNSLYLAASGFRTEGIDLSEQAIAWARERSAGQAKQATFVCGSIYDEVPSSQSLDLIYDSGCFHHLAPHRRHQYIQLISSALKPGAHFGLVCFAPEAGSGYSDEEVYKHGSLGGGIGYSESHLRKLWGQDLSIVELRRMNDLPAGAGKFGKEYLWVMLARR